MLIVRYDLGEHYEIESSDPKECSSSPLNGLVALMHFDLNIDITIGKMSSPWAWVPYANYSGQIEEQGIILDVWSFSAAGVSLRLAVTV